MSQVFISYSRRDLDFVKRLVQAFEAIRIDPWLDQEDIEPAANWRERIQAGVESADNFIYVISPTSVKSNECGQELELALRSGKRLIPIVYREIDPQLAHPALAATNWIFFRDAVDDFQTAFAMLVTAIKTDLAWAHVHSRIQTRALEWQRRNQDPSFLLRGKDLQDAEQHLAGVGPDRNPQPTELQRQYVLACRQDVTRRQRRNFIAVSIALVLVVGLAIVAFLLRGQALSEKERAEKAESTAVFERDQKATAQVQAEAARSTAVVERNQKATAQVVAETQRAIAVSRQLAAQAQVLMARQFDLALLLAIEASRGTTDGQLSLSNLLLAEPHLIRIVTGSKGYLWGGGEAGFIESLALSPDGNQLVAQSYVGARFWDFNSHQTQELDPGRYQEYLQAWTTYQRPSPSREGLLRTLEISNLTATSSAVLNLAAFSACRTTPSAGGSPGCDSLIYIFSAEFDRLVTPLASCSPGENAPDFRIELEGGLYRIWRLQSAPGQPADFELYSVALANKASNNGSELVGALYDPNTKRLFTVAAVSRFGSELALVVWDLDDKKPVLELFTPLWDASLANLHFSNAGTALDVCVNGAGLQVDIAPESWQAQACEMAGRNFTQAEWQQYFPGEGYRQTCSQWPSGE